jgi:hypothetical protein
MNNLKREGKINKKGAESVSLQFTDRALSILALVGKTSKDPLERRLIRIRRNLVNAVKALNKELLRHKPKIIIRQTLRTITLEDGSKFTELP